MYSSYSFTTSVLDGGEWSVSRPGRALPPEKGPPVPIVEEAGWAPEPVWTQRLEEKSLASVGDRTSVVQSVARDYTDWATPAPYILYYSLMMEGVHTSETSVNIYLTTRQYIPEDSKLHTRRRENLKSHTNNVAYLHLKWWCGVFLWIYEQGFMYNSERFVL
jgi:hypothetical protein